MPPPPEVSAGAIEEELSSLDEKIKNGGGKPADAEKFNQLLQTFQGQERKKPKKDFPLPKLRFNGHGRYEQGFGMPMSVAAAQAATCGEFKNILYDCAELPWDAIDSWTRGGETGDISVRECAPDDACASPGVLQIDSNDALMLGRIEEGLVSERFASATFRIRHSILEKNPQPDTTLFGGGVVWIDDGVKSTAVGFFEDLSGVRLLIVPIDGQYDPETGELNITDTIVIYYDWGDWKEYRLAKDAEGLIELFADGDPIPIFSYPYASLNMGSFGGPVVMFGNLIDGQVARVLFELDYFNYSVGMQSNDGCTNADGKMQLLSLINMTKVFDPTYEANDVVGRLKIATVEGLASNTQGHKFLLRASREIRDSAGNIIRLTSDDTQIGPIGTGQNPPDMIADGLSSWNGTDTQGERAPDGVYTYGIKFDLVRADTKGKEKVLSTMQAAGSPVMLTTSRATPRVFKNVNATKYYFAYDYIQSTEVRKFRKYALYNCSGGADPILDVFWEQTGGENPYAKVATNDYSPYCRDQWPAQCYDGSLVTITPQKPGWVFMVIRAKALNKGGTCSLDRIVQDGKWTNWVKSFKFGGNRVDWGWGAGEEIQNVIMGDGQDTLLIQSNPGSYTNPYEIPPDGTGKPSWDDEKGIAKASKVVVASGLTAGSTFIGQKPWATEGASHVYRNDVDNDSDGDGLGDSLEVALQTCNGQNAVAGGWPCSNTFNTQDTDGDGLPDAIEVFGCDKLCYVGSGIVKKGCFTDHTLCPGVLIKSDFPQQIPKWGANPRRKDIFVEVDTYTVSGSTPTMPLSEADAQRARDKFGDVSSTVVSPDGNKGFSIHVDTGQKCADTTLCGNWGGSNRIVGPGPECRPSDFAAGNFRDVRKGLFHQGVAQLCETTTSSRWGDSFTFANRVPGAGNFLHALGHNLGLDDGGLAKDGKFQFKPNYTSVMNYAFAEKFNGSTDLVHFSSGNYEPLNPKFVCESTGLGGPDPAYLTFFPFEFETSGSAVDWNRDGYIETDCGHPVEAFVHAAKRNAVSGRYFHRNVFWLRTVTSSPPVLASFKGSLYMFYVDDDSRLWYRQFERMNSCSPLEPFHPCDEWEPQRHEVPLPTGILDSPALAEIPSPTGAPRLYLVYVDARDLGIKYVYAEGSLDNWVVPPDPILPGSTFSHSAAALASDGAWLTVAYRDGDSGQIFESWLPTNGGDWVPAHPSVDSNGNPMVSVRGPSFALRPIGDSGVLHMAYGAAPDGKISVVHRAVPGSPWTAGVNLVTGANPVIPDPWATDAFTEGMIGFVWRPNPTIREHGGHFHVLYPQKGSDKLVFDFMTFDQTAKKWRWNMASETQNVAPYGASLAFYQGGGLANVVAAFAESADRHIWFYPYTDGVYDIDLKDGNDWETMRKGACISVRKATGDQCSLCGTDADWCLPFPNCCQGGVAQPPIPVTH